MFTPKISSWLIAYLLLLIKANDFPILDNIFTINFAYVLNYLYRSNA